MDGFFGSPTHVASSLDPLALLIAAVCGAAAMLGVLLAADVVRAAVTVRDGIVRAIARYPASMSMPSYSWMHGPHHPVALPEQCFASVEFDGETRVVRVSRGTYDALDPGSHVRVFCTIGRLTGRVRIRNIEPAVRE